MNVQPIRLFRTITLRPHWMQYVINEIPASCIFVVSFICCLKLNYSIFYIRELLFLCYMLAMMYLMFRLIYFARMEYIVTREQIIIMHGVFSHSTDYVELYRVVDYRQHRSLIQQLCGLKTVTIYSGDRNNSIVNLIGIKNDVDLISDIRQRVEFNKHNKGIYEFTNR